MLTKCLNLFVRKIKILWKDSKKTEQFIASINWSIIHSYEILCMKRLITYRRNLDEMSNLSINDG